MKITINLELTNLSQAEAVQQALEHYIECEESRFADEPKDFTAADKLRLNGGREVLQSMTGSAVRVVRK